MVLNNHLLDSTFSKFELRPCAHKRTPGSRALFVCTGSTSVLCIHMQAVPFKSVGIQRLQTQLLLPIRHLCGCRCVSLNAVHGHAHPHGCQIGKNSCVPIDINGTACMRMHKTSVHPVQANIALCTDVHLSTPAETRLKSLK